MSCVPGLPPPPDTHPASPRRRGAPAAAPAPAAHDPHIMMDAAAAQDRGVAKMVAGLVCPQYAGKFRGVDAEGAVAPAEEQKGGQSRFVSPPPAQVTTEEVPASAQDRGVVKMLAGVVCPQYAGKFRGGDDAKALRAQLLGGNRPSMRHNNAKLDARPQAPVPPPHYAAAGRKGLLIGVNYIGQKAELSGCVNDVERVQQRLRGQYDLRVLTDGARSAGDPECDPTRANILAGFDWLTDGLREGGGATVLLHFSGHGSQQVDVCGDEADGMDETICPVDYATAGMISDDDIKERLVLRIPKGNRLLAVMDCCHSGTVLDLPYYCVSDGTRRGEQMHADQLSDGNGVTCDVMMLSGCKDAQTSADVSDAHAAFGGSAQDRGVVKLLAGVVCPQYAGKFRGVDPVVDAGGGAGAPAARDAGGALTSALLLATEEAPRDSVTAMLAGIRRRLEQRGFAQVPQFSASRPYDVTATVFDVFPPHAADSGTVGVEPAGGTAVVASGDDAPAPAQQHPAAETEFARAIRERDEALRAAMAATRVAEGAEAAASGTETEFARAIRERDEACARATAARARVDQTTA